MKNPIKGPNYYEYLGHLDTVIMGGSARNYWSNALLPNRREDQRRASKYTKSRVASFRLVRTK